MSKGVPREKLLQMKVTKIFLSPSTIHRALESIYHYYFKDICVSLTSKDNLIAETLLFFYQRIIQGFRSSITFRTFYKKKDNTVWRIFLDHA